MTTTPTWTSPAETARVAAGLTPEQAAKLLNLSVTYLRGIERGTRECPYYTAVCLAGIYDIKDINIFMVSRPDWARRKSASATSGRGKSTTKKGASSKKDKILKPANAGGSGTTPRAKTLQNPVTQTKRNSGEGCAR